MLVVHRGWLVYERYFGLGDREATPNLASVGKSVTSVAAGILMAEEPKRFPDRPLARSRRTVEQVRREPGQQAAEVAEGALRQGQNATRFGMRAVGHARVHLLRVLQRPIEGVPDVHLPPAPWPRARQRLVVERGEPA